MSGGLERQRLGEIARRDRPQTLQAAAHELGDGRFARPVFARAISAGAAIGGSSRALRVDGLDHAAGIRRRPRRSRSPSSQSRGAVARRSAASRCARPAGARAFLLGDQAQRIQRIVQLVGVGGFGPGLRAHLRRWPPDRACPCRPRFPDRASGAAPPRWCGALRAAHRRGRRTAAR